MAGKRPDQHNIAPSEAGATDYKHHPQSTHGKDQDLDMEGDKQRLAQSMKEGKGQPFLPDVPAPTADANRGKKLQEDTDPEKAGAADTETRKENPLA